MLRTFNCGVGFCIIIDKKNIKKIKRYFSKDYMPYEIGYISSNGKKLNLYNSIKWEKKMLVFLFQVMDQI